MKEENQDKAEKIKKYLAEEFGIHTYEQFLMEFDDTPEIDIGIFVSPIVKKDE